MGRRLLPLPAPFGDLARFLGGPDALAQALRISRHTLRRWARGVQAPDGPGKFLVEVLCREYQISPAELPWSHDPKKD